jgi:hypothetical protein
MRNLSIALGITVGMALLAVSSFAQRPGGPPGGGPAFPQGGPQTSPEGRPPAGQAGPPDGRFPAGPPRCCAKAFDATGKLIGDVIRWDDRIPSYPLNALVRFPIKGGGDTVLVVSPEAIRSVQEPGGSVALFTTPDCSGNDMFAMLSWPPLVKRYSMVLPAGNPSTLLIAATHAWLFVTDPLPARVSPGATVFHSQWGESGACIPYPAPGYTVSGTPFGGFWMKRVGDLYTVFKRPFYTE